MSLFAELKRRNVIRVAIAYGVVAWLVVQIADVMIDNIGAPDWVFMTLLMTLAIGFPVALVFAWAFELTPEGLKRDHEVDRAGSITPQTGRRLDRFIIAILVLVVAWFLFDEFYLEPRDQLADDARVARADAAPATTVATGQAEQPASVAVLPFRAMSSGEDDEYFADGLTEEILNSLAQVPGLSVTSRTSAFYFKDKDLPIGDIADQLGVDHVVEGSVRRSGDRLRVTAQLIRTADDTHLWSNNYDRTDADAIEVQEDIARQIAETLNVFLDENTLARMRRAGIRNVDAFIEYARGVDMHMRAHGSDHQLEELRQANTHLEAALEAAPGFAAAWVFYSDYYTHLLVDSAMGALQPRPSEDVLDAAYAETQRAFQQAARHATNPGERAAAELDLAIVRGDAETWRPLFNDMLDAEGCLDYVWAHLIGHLPEFRDRFRMLLERLIQCDPMALNNRSDLVDILTQEGRPEAALEVYENFPAEGNDFMKLGEISALLRLDRIDAAESVAAIDITSAGSRYMAHMLIAAKQGDTERMLALRERMVAEMHLNDFRALLIAAMMGDRKSANAFAKRMDAEPMGHMALMASVLWCECGSPFDLDAAPRFANLWRRADFPWPLEPNIEFPLKDW